LRFVVCGTTFGRVHLAALRARQPWGELVGIVARGSDRSLACAAQLGVPLYTDVDDLPDTVDAACVAVRASVAGGGGTELAERLLGRGIHVLQEHPVHHDELARCLRTARRQGVVHRINDHYLHVEAVRRFVAAAAVLRRQAPVLYVEAGTGIQVAYALIDILAQVLPSMRPWGFADPADPAQLGGLLAAAPPMRSIDAVFGGVPVGIRVHNQLDPREPDNHAHLLHRIAITTAAGTLSLTGTHGPVLWSPRLHVDQDDDPTGERRLARPSSATLPGTDPGDWATVIGTDWPLAMGRALAEFAGEVHRGADPMRAGQGQLTVCRVWQDLTTRLGQPELIVGAAPPTIDLAELAGPPEQPAPARRLHALPAVTP
jgi:thiazolinyl imide reductase